MCLAGDDGSDGCSSLQVLFNLGRVLPVEPLRLLIELGVSLVNVVDVCVVIVRTPSTVFFTLFNLFFKICNHSVNPFLRRHVSSVEKTVRCGIERFTAGQEQQMGSSLHNRFDHSDFTASV